MASIGTASTTTEGMIQNTFSSGVLANDLWERYPPKILAGSKKHLLMSMAMENKDTKRPSPQGMVNIDRWIGELPKTIAISNDGNNKTVFEYTEKVFEYNDDGTVMAFYVNFSDVFLFQHYASPMLAQDELQVAECPTLACVREYLLANHVATHSPAASPVYSEDVDDGTKLVLSPVVICGVERRLAIDARGMYGNRFRVASEEQVKKQTVVLPSPYTTVNVICMVARQGFNEGAPYTKAVLIFHLQTAYVAFKAAVLNTALIVAKNNNKKQEKEHHQQQKMTTTTIHTGNWGTGVFGGNATVMAYLQMCAAQLAGVHTLVYHTIDRTEAYLAAKTYYDAHPVSSFATVDAMLDLFLLQGYTWARSSF